MDEYGNLEFLYSPVTAPAPLGETVTNAAGNNYQPPKSFWKGPQVEPGNYIKPDGTLRDPGVSPGLTTPDTPISNTSGYLQEEKAEAAYIPPDELGATGDLANTLMDANEIGGKAGARRARRADRRADRAARNEEGLTGQERRDRRRAERSSRKDSWAIYKAGGI